MLVSFCTDDNNIVQIVIFPILVIITLVSTIIYIT